MADIQTADAAPSPSPKIRKIDADQPWSWLAAGWNDLRRAPVPSLAFGLTYAIAGMVLTGLVVIYDVFFLTAPLLAGFMLLGPILAVGLYQISRRLEQGQSVGLGDVLTAWRDNPAQIAYMGLTLMLFLLAWMRIAQLIFALFNSYAPPPVEPIEFINFLLSTERIPFLLTGTVIGGVLAVIVFAISAISIPLLLDRKNMHVIHAMVVSVRAVRDNLWPMLLWAWLVAMFIGVGLATAYVGLIITLPLIGHATWHAYKDIVDWDGTE